jgi:hypothetical protein
MLGIVGFLCLIQNVLTSSPSSEYIMDFVWKSVPVGAGNIFFETQAVEYNARVKQG